MLGGIGFGYILVMIAGLVISGIASMWVKRSYSKHSKEMSASGMTGAQVARSILDRNGLTNVRVEPVAGPVHAQDAGHRRDHVAAVADHHRVRVEYAVELGAEAVVVDGGGVRPELGASGGQRIGIIGTKDTNGDALVEAGSATKVYAT